MKPRRKKLFYARLVKRWPCCEGKVELFVGCPDPDDDLDDWGDYIVAGGIWESEWKAIGGPKLDDDGSPSRIRIFIERLT